MERYLTVREVAALLRMAPATIRQWVHQRKIPSIKLGGRVLFEENQVRRWVKAQARPVKAAEDK